MDSVNRHIRIGWFIALLFLSAGAQAQPVPPSSLPGPADAARVGPEPEDMKPHRSEDKAGISRAAPLVDIPDGADRIELTLKDVRIEGATAFPPAVLRSHYAAYLGRKVTLDVAWIIAASITARYREAGYFLSQAYVLRYENDGVISIQVIEGYIGSIEIDHDIGRNFIFQKQARALLKEIPLSAEAVESFLLRLNDMPGLSFRAVLSALENAPPGAVKLVLIPEEKKGSGMISFDNYASRFLGPNELSFSYAKSFLPLQQTSLSLLGSLPLDELKYGALSHSILIAPDLTLQFTGAVTRSEPGYTLKPFEIQSKSLTMSAKLIWQWIRQRQKNLAMFAMLDRRDTRSDILGTVLSRDYIRTLRAGFTYDRTDGWNGYNVMNFTVSRGLDVWGASPANDPDSSRAEAKPGFTKAELSLTRLQALSENWSVSATVCGQIASGPLYSAEEFGYGEEGIGRAYDSSEITGDHGVRGGMELRYAGWQNPDPVGFVPYVFYDIGAVWNEDSGQNERESGASAGVGVRMGTKTGLSANVGVAFPLTRKVATPIYGAHERSPRLLLQISQSF